MCPLPIDAYLPELLALLRERSVAVLVAEPGAGKTTRVPPAVVRSGLLGQGKLVMLQPRRVAARAAAERIAEENGWTLGREVGFHVRFEKRVSRDTPIRVLTEGILTRQLLEDPELGGVGCVILDEFHERSIHADLALALLRECRSALRPDLKLLVMSATLDAEAVSRYLDDAPVVRVPGRTFPVEVEFDSVPESDEIDRRASRATTRVLRQTTREQGGDVLVFLPGAEEIRRTLHALEESGFGRDHDLLPLHGSLPPGQQTRALRPGSRRKVVCATNIAETSLTIEGVRTVIDSGWARVPRFDLARGIDRLELRRISRASADQRAGRAGRTSAGRCLRLWTARQHAGLEPFDLPEIQAIDLASTLLSLHAWGVSDVRSFEWFERPDDARLEAAERLLTDLGALEGGRLTDLGRALSEYPLHPRLARVMLESRRLGRETLGATLVSLLSEPEILDLRGLPPDTTAESDLSVRLQALEHAERAGFAPHLRDAGIDPQAARGVARLRDQLLGRAVAPGQILDQTPHAELLLVGYPDRVCRRRSGEARRAIMVDGSGVRLAAESCVHSPEFFLALDARHDARSRAAEAVVRVACAVTLEELRRSLPHRLTTQAVTRFDAQAQRVLSVRLLRLGELTLRETPGEPIDPDEAAAVLFDALRPQARELLESDEHSVSMLRRIELLRVAMPELGWPVFDEPTVERLLEQACVGCRSVDQVRQGGLTDSIAALLGVPLGRLLDRHAPTYWQVPTGNRIRLDYPPGGQPPVLAVRLQEMFGQCHTPTIADGRVAVVLHLLGPNYRPVQVTTDLSSFWANTYPQVRKDLRARYPKHAWPEDPTRAAPVAKGRSTR